MLRLRWAVGGSNLKVLSLLWGSSSARSLSKWMAVWRTLFLGLQAYKSFARPWGSCERVGAWQALPGAPTDACCRSVFRCLGHL